MGKGNMSALQGYPPTFDPFGSHIPPETVDTTTSAAAGATHAVAKVLSSPYMWVAAGLVLLFLLK